MSYARLIVTGTDTGIGKTVFAAALTGALDAFYWKPVQSGPDEFGGTDADRVARLSHVAPERIVPEAWRLGRPLSPHRAAELDGVAIDPDALTVPDVPGPLVIEGAGGALVPLTRGFLYADLFARWRLPVVVVARTGLGTINHSLLTLEALRARGIDVLGFAFVGDANEDNERTIAEMGQTSRLGRLPVLEPLDRENLSQAFADNFDLEDFLP